MSITGSVYTANGQSGVTITGFAQSSGLGSIVSGSPEGSNVDLAFALTEMIRRTAGLYRKFNGASNGGRYPGRSRQSKALRSA